MRIFSRGRHSPTRAMRTSILFLSLLLLSSYGSKCSAQQPGSSTEDSLEQAYADGKYFFPTIVRLHKGSHAFIFIDSDYAASAIVDPKVRDMYFHTALLAPDKREAYYATISRALRKDDVKILDIIWSLKEVKGQVASDGGLYTLVTLISDRPSAVNQYYEVEIRRMYYWRLGICTDIGFVKINPKTNEILVMDVEGSYLPLKEWRAAESKL